MAVPKRKLDPGAHMLGIRQLYPQFSVKQLAAGRYRIIGKLQPREDLPEYAIRIEYGRSLPRPSVFVVDPQLVPNPKHVFPDGSLCLFKSEDFTWWNRPRVIADYIIPWTSKWLLYYEGWLLTGKWYGDEAVHFGEKAK